MRENKELKKIAKGILLGEIFTHLDLPNATYLPKVFVPLMHMSDEQLIPYLGANLLYEHKNQATTNTFEGFPVFPSFQILTKEEHEVVIDIIKKGKV
jgi:hypothetical protein